MIGVLLVDDERMVCAYLRTILSCAADITVVGEAHDGAEAVEAVLRHRPDVVLLDLRMPEVDGLAALDRIMRLDSPPKVVALTTFDVDAYVLRAMRAGAAGFLLKSTAPDDLVELVRVAARGHTVLSPAATHQLISAAREGNQARDQIKCLTARETDVLACLGGGLSNAEIGRRLHITEATVKGYVSNVLMKLDCDNRTRAGLIAHEAGLS